jgi:hypothetical protein
VPRGIAGSCTPEREDCFVCAEEAEEEVEWFISSNNTGGAVDASATDGFNEAELAESPEGLYLLTRIAPERLTLARRNCIAWRPLVCAHRCPGVTARR